MAHLTLHLGGPIVVPLSTHLGSRRQRRSQSWKLRFLLEGSAIDVSLAVQRMLQRQRNVMRARPYLVALHGDILDGNEA